MSSPILFRSIRSGRDRAGYAHSTIRQRGSSWSHLRSYTDTDDTRDIAWAKMRPDGLSVRERENHGDFEIISFWEMSSYDDFFTMDPHDSRKNAIQKARHDLRMSAQFGQYSYREFFGEIGFKELKSIKPSNTLIFICNSHIDDSLRSLAFHNDLIYLDIFHPFEAHPDVSLLFSGQVVDIKGYRKAYQDFKENQKNTIKKLRGSYISLSTKDDITDILNSFFKKRYHE